MFKSLLLIFTLLNSSLQQRGRKINIYGAENGHGDIVDLRNKNSDQLRSDVMRNAILPNSPLKWNTMKDSDGNYVIPYKIQGVFDRYELSIIQKAMSVIAENTCIRFIRRTNQRDYVSIDNKKNEGCYTSIGRFPGKNIIMLESNRVASCLHHETVVHELFHAIGLWHEHMRSDRDDYISVLYDNIMPSQYSQFAKLSSSEATTYNVPYDYHSVMHYDPTAFALPGRISMVTKDPLYQSIIGKPADASPRDYLKICSIYQCPKCMGQPFDKNSRDGFKVQNSCVDELAICSTLYENGVLNCNAMSEYCCASCLNEKKFGKVTITTTTLAPIYTPSGLWSRIVSIFT